MTDRYNKPALSESVPLQTGVCPQYCPMKKKLILKAIELELLDF